MTSKAQIERLRRFKAACEAIEDELNRLPPPWDDAWDAMPDGPMDLSNAMHAVIRHLKRRWADLNAEHE